MSNIKFNNQQKEILDSFLLKIPVVSPGKMYGYPAYYVGGKLFASLYNEGVCIKVPEEKVKELLEKEYIFHFEPMGRKMREWVFIVRENPNDYTKDIDLFETSLEYVSSIAGINWEKNK